mmetsp:Transcript_1237/g.4013  ORF Transcript_1237/g.4013 Transcript_1237/m.4013 type:complete len:418 (-) Transcript_1237:1073-2326(-)
MTPRELSCPDMPTRIANQKSVSQAAGYVRHSLHVSTPDNKRPDRPIIAVVTADTPMASPQTHKHTAAPMVPSMIFSSLPIGPMLSRRFVARAGASGVSLISGAKMLYMMSGVSRRQTTAGTTAALNQVTHAEGISTPISVAIFRQSRFWAAAVRNSAEELTDPWNWELTRKAPSFFLDSSFGLDPALRDRELMIGMNMPPALAVVEGMAGAISISAKERPYASPSVLFPKNLTKIWATRSPSPVFSKPLAKKNETTMSQMTSFVNAEKVCVNVSVLVAMATVADRNAQAPTGRGSSTSPAMVDTKMDRSVQPCCEMPAGVGTAKLSTRPSDTHTTSGTIFAPGHEGEAGGAAAAAAQLTGEIWAALATAERFVTTRDCLVDSLQAGGDAVDAVDAVTVVLPRSGLPLLHGSGEGEEV